MQLLTVNQVAARLGVSRGLVYALVRGRRIRFERFGTGRGTIRISEEALEEFRQKCLRETQEAQPVLAGQAPSSSPSRSGFTNLDAGRLLEAWKEQGAVRN